MLLPISTVGGARKEQANDDYYYLFKPSNVGKINQCNLRVNCKLQ